MTTDTEIGVIQGGGHELRNVGDLQKLAKANWLSPRTSRRKVALKHLDLSSARLILSFLTSITIRETFVLFASTKFVLIYYSSSREITHPFILKYSLSSG